MWMGGKGSLMDQPGKNSASKAIMPRIGGSNTFSVDSAQ